MRMLPQLLASGAMTGVIYGLIALGFVLIYKGAKVFNLAVGEMVMLGGFVFWTAIFVLKLPIWLSVILALAGLLILGLAVERFTFRPLIGQPLLSSVMMTIALALILRGFVVLVWGAVPRPRFEIFPTAPLRMGGLVISQGVFWGFVVALGCFAAFGLFFKFTRMGLVMRAAAEDQQVAQSLGISVKGVLAMVWVLAGLLTAIGGVLLSNITGVGLTLADIGMRALPVAVFAGLESILGALVGGAIVGVAESLAGGYLDPLTQGGMMELTPYILMAVMLLFRPYGLFGLKTIERV
jgi:branched-chain amino acid transport system permease protein